jgi:pyruvate carboxylase
MLISAIRAELPGIPIRAHAHDTAGNGVARMLAAANAGADIVNATMYSFS